MSKKTQYLLDANVLMEAKRRYYRFGLCPGFWDCIAWQYKQGTLGSIDRIKKEIDQGKDDLTQWAKQSAPKGFFAATTEQEVATWFGKMVAWAQAEKQYLPEAKTEFASGNDAWLIAYAKQHGLTVVTHETYDAQIKNRVKIPNVCDKFGVPCIDTFDMLEALNTQFTWKNT
jgi:predicted nucleic acid-binding protein